MSILIKILCEWNILNPTRINIVYKSRQDLFHQFRHWLSYQLASRKRMLICLIWSLWNLQVQDFQSKVSTCWTPKWPNNALAEIFHFIKTPKWPIYVFPQNWAILGFVSREISLPHCPFGPFCGPPWNLSQATGPQTRPKNDSGPNFTTNDDLP